MSNTWPGVALPWNGTVPDFFSLKDDIDVLKTSIIMIIMTRKGERVMVPDFGSIVPELVFEPNDVGAMSGLRQAIEQALAEWDDRIEVVDVKTEMQEHTLKCNVMFKNRMDATEEAVYAVGVELGADVAS